MAEIAAKPLKVTGVPGISARQLAEHYTLYVGYVNKLEDIREALREAGLSMANQTYSALRAAKAAEPFALNGVKLHELYFENLGGTGGRPSGRLLEMIERDWGSFEAWEAQFKACGVAARGWVVLAYDPLDGRLQNFSMDAHDVGAIWGAVPLLVMDTYEHAYVIDYGVKRPPYIEAFMKNIDWDVVNRRWKEVLGNS